MAMALKRVCVFCGARPGKRPAYLEAAKALGQTLAAEGLQLIYGGASVGLMGAMADAALAAGGEVVGVMPKHLVDKEIAHRGLTALHVTASMHTRKERMAELSDAVIALPGGFGTWDELFEIVTWNQIGLIQKPCGLLDVEGYFGPMKAMIARAVEDGFVPADHARIVSSAETAGPLLAQLRAFTPVEAVGRGGPKPIP